MKKEATKEPENSSEQEEAVKDLERLKLERNVYRALKRDLIGMEQENLSEIVMLKCSGEGDWFEMADHSALIYYYMVCQPLKLKNIRFEADYDSYFEQYKIGRIRTRGTDVVRNRLKQAEMYDGEYVTTGRIFFKLKKALGKDKISMLEKREAKRRMNLNKTVEIKHADPLFYRNLAAMLHKLHIDCSSKLDKLTSQTNGARIVALVDKIMATYLHSTDVPEENLEIRENDWREIRKDIYQMKYEIQILDIAGKWAPDQCIGFVCD